MNPMITNLVIMLFFMQVSKKIPFEDPNVLLGVRIAYIASNLIIAGIYVYIQTKINAKKDMTVLKYLEPAPMGSTDEPKTVVTTNHAYDLQQVRGAFRGQAMGLVMTLVVMHLYFKYTNPLLIQSVLPVKSALESNLAKVYLFGKPATGELKRPWKQQGPLAGLQQGDVKADKKTVEAAERAGRGGAKEE